MRLKTGQVQVMRVSLARSHNLPHALHVKPRRCLFAVAGSRSKTHLDDPGNQGPPGDQTGQQPLGSLRPGVDLALLIAQRMSGLVIRKHHRQGSEVLAGEQSLQLLQHLVQTKRVHVWCGLVRLARRAWGGGEAGRQVLFLPEGMALSGI